MGGPFFNYPSTLLLLHFFFADESSEHNSTEEDEGEEEAGEEEAGEDEPEAEAVGGDEPRPKEDTESIGNFVEILNFWLFFAFS